MKNITKLILTAFLINIAFNFINAQPTQWKNKKYFTIVGYNVENLFDTINDPSINDSEYTPESKKKYDTRKYNEKLENLSKVLSSINKNELPEIIGLTEIENRLVLKDLVATPLLKPANYQIVLEEGPDGRGIDCGFIYRADVFKYISHKALEVRFPFANNKRTRDILYVKGMVKRDTVHIFINHWSSRRGGQEESEPKRVESARVLKQNIDSILTVNNQANIIALGDFNDTPENKSLNDVLSAGRVSEQKALVNLMYEQHDNKKGSYYYKGNYDMIDNLVVTPNLMNKPKGFRLYENKGWIFNPEFLCYTHKNGDKAPGRSFGGNNYYGGYSDHFAIYTIFYEK